MRVEIKNLTPTVVQTEQTQAEIDRLNAKAKQLGGNNKLSFAERSLLARLKRYGDRAYAQNMCIHNDPEEPAEVPTVEDPVAIKKKKRMVSTSNCEGEKRRYDDLTGEPVSFRVEDVDEKAFYRIIKEIKSGVSPYQACTNKRIIPDEFFRKCKENARWQRELDDAREVYAESQVARLEKLSAQLERRTIDSTTYNLVTNNIKWLVEKLFPTLYGNKTRVEQVVTHNVEISQEKLKELNDLLRGNKPLEVEYQEVK